MLASRCGPMHVRLMKLEDSKTEEPKDLDEGEVYDGNAPTVFEQQNIEKIQKIIDAGPQIMSDPNENEEIVEGRTEYCRKKIKEINADRYSCQFCEKLFKAPHYVQNHILNKHEDKIAEKVDNKIFDEMLFDSFIKNQKLILVFIQTELQSTFRPRGNFHQGRRPGYNRDNRDHRDHRDSRDHRGRDDYRRNNSN